MIKHRKIGLCCSDVCRRLLAMKCVLALTVVCGMVLPVAADTIVLSNATSGWQVKQGVGGAWQSVYEISPNVAWNHTLEPLAKWISIAPNDGLAASGATFYYRLALSLVPGMYQLDGQFTSDNTVTSFTLNGMALAADPPLTGNIYDFQRIFTVRGWDDSPLTIEAAVFNENTVSPGPTNPTGFIFAGRVTPVPLPPAAWAGVALMGVMGLRKVIASRRRLA